MSDVAVVTLLAVVTSSVATKLWGTSFGSVCTQRQPAKNIASQQDPAFVKFRLTEVVL